MNRYWSMGLVVAGFAAASCGKNMDHTTTHGMHTAHVDAGSVDMGHAGTGSMDDMGHAGTGSMDMGHMHTDGMSMAGTAGMGGMDMGHMNIPPARLMFAPPPWSGDLAVPILADENPDPRVVEVSLVAGPAEVEYLPGKRSTVWAYNGTVPGPTLRAKLGDEVVVHFTNQLPEPTSIHWHGVRVPNDMDGTQNVREPIPPGGTFDYRFKVLDAGNFWYHPHIRSDLQVHRGLYAGLIVEDPMAPLIPVASDDTVLLSDVNIDAETGALDDTEDTRAEMMGREGNLALINGRRSNLGLAVKAGEARRLRIVNAANARYFRLELTQGVMVRLGGEMLLQAPEAVREILLAPGMRTDVLVWVEQMNTTATLRAIPYQRAMGAASTEAIDLLRLVAGSEPAEIPAALPSQVTPISLLEGPSAFKVVELSERMSLGEQEFLINGSAHPLVPTFTSALGSIEQWRIINRSDMDHPFHLHGFFFQVAGEREWRDTINVPTMEEVSILVDFRDRPGATGNWFYHCHILEHAERGMMGEVNVR